MCFEIESDRNEWHRALNQTALMTQSQAGIKLWLMLSRALDIKPAKLFLQIIIRILPWHLHAMKLTPVIGKARDAVCSQAVHFCQFADSCIAKYVCDIVKQSCPNSLRRAFLRPCCCSGQPQLQVQKFPIQQQAFQQPPTAAGTGSNLHACSHTI